MSDELDEELYEHYDIMTDPGQSPMRVDKFLMERIEKASRNQIQNAIKAGHILIDGKNIKSPSFCKLMDRRPCLRFANAAPTDAGLL